MKFITMTHESQGKNKKDFQNAKEGELARNASTGSLMVGIDSNLAGTTTKIVELDTTREELIKTYTESFKKSFGAGDEEFSKTLAVEEVDEMIRISNAFPVGSILETKGSVISTRLA